MLPVDTCGCQRCTGLSSSIQPGRDRGNGRDASHPLTSVPSGTCTWMAFRAFVLFFFAITKESSFKCLIWPVLSPKLPFKELLFFSKQLDALGWVWREFLQEHRWFMAASWMQLQTQTGQDWLNGTSRLHLCSRRASVRSGIHCTRTLVGPQRHVTTVKEKAFFPHDHVLLCKRRNTWKPDGTGPVLGLLWGIYSRWISLWGRRGWAKQKCSRQNSLLFSITLEDWSAHKCLSGEEKLFTKSRFLGACPSTEHVVLTPEAEAWWLKQDCWALSWQLLTFLQASRIFHPGLGWHIFNQNNINEL